MTDAKKGGSGKDLLAKHGEKIGLGVAAALLLGYLVFGYLPDKKVPDLETARGTMARVQTAMRTPQPGDAPEAAQPWEQKAIGPWNTVVPLPRGADNWAASLATDVTSTTKKRETVRPPQAVAPSVAFENLEINLDSVVLSWTVQEFTAAEKAKMAKEKPVHIPVGVTSFKIERDVNGAGKWETLTTIEDGKARSYKDVKIEPKTKYAYRITAFSNAKEYLANGGEESGPKADGIVALVPSPAAQTLGIWKISYANASRPANAEQGIVYVTIEKFEKAIGQKVERRQIHKDGDRIGWKAAADGQEPTSKFKVQVANKAVEVDFDTGLTLVSVKPRKVTVEITKCKRKFGPGGVPEYPCDKIKEKRTFDIYEIVVNGPEGRQTIQSPNPKQHPNGQDQICEECGGKKAVTTLPPGETKPPEMPKEDPAAAAAKKKEADAAALFKEAEKLLKDGKAREAIVRFERLLKEFGATDFVAKEQRPLIEQRLGEARAK